MGSPSHVKIFMQQASFQIWRNMQNYIKSKYLKGWGQGFPLTVYNCKHSSINLIFIEQGRTNISIKANTKWNTLKYLVNNNNRIIHPCIPSLVPDLSSLQAGNNWLYSIHVNISIFYSKQNFVQRLFIVLRSLDAAFKENGDANTIHILCSPRATAGFPQHIG